MSDQRLRELERSASRGDHAAARELEAHEGRTGYATKLLPGRLGGYVSRELMEVRAQLIRVSRGFRRIDPYFVSHSDLAVLRAGSVASRQARFNGGVFALLDELPALDPPLAQERVLRWRPTLVVIDPDLVDGER